MLPDDAMWRRLRSPDKYAIWRFGWRHGYLIVFPEKSGSPMLERSSKQRPGRRSEHSRRAISLVHALEREKDQTSPYRLVIRLRSSSHAGPR